MANDRVLACQVCGVNVTLSRKRLRQLARERQHPLCEQCRRYVSPAAARVSQPVGESGDIATRLRHKTGKGAKTKRGLASWPLKRCGKVDYDDGV